VAICLRTPFDEAEELKKKWGHACPDEVPADRELDIAAFGEESHQKIPQRLLAEVLNARVEEIANMILQEIKRSGYDGLLPAGVVLCGGTADLPGICDIVRSVVGLPVRVGSPQDLQGLVDQLTHPAFATSVGLLMWEKNHKSTVRPRPAKSPMGDRVVKWFRNLLPD
jgi:cell division protein FtsA